jgi:uncharacterized protein YyaL (SSP411 family)
MPNRQPRSSFPVTTGLMVVLALIFGADAALREHIPPPPPNRLVAGGEDYLLAGTRQDIDWRAMGEEALAVARRLERPLLVVISDKSSLFARMADRDAFTDPEVTALLRQAFVCVRIDASQFPEWTSAFLPARRTVLGFDPRFQVWVLDPYGRMVGSALVRAPGHRMAAEFFLPLLRDALLNWREGAVDPDLRGGFGREQREDQEFLHGGDGFWEPDPERHGRWLAVNLDREHGGWPHFGFQPLLPNSFAFLLETGDLDTFRRALDPVLASPVVDWLDGGFFTRATSTDWTLVEFDKFAVQNAEMMALLAKAWRSTGEDLYRKLAVATFDALTGDFLEGGLPAAYRIGDERPDRRSRRSSFPVRELRQILTPAGRESARELLGLRVETNPLMVVRAPDPAAAAGRWLEFEGVLAKLRESRRDVRTSYGGFQQLDAAGTAVARLLETARLLEDPARLDRAAMLFDRLQRFRIGKNDVFHANTPSGRAYQYLGDYLAYADAALQDYLSFGWVGSARDGLLVLLRALNAFAGPANGALLDGRAPRGGLALADVPSANLADDVGESSIARAMRLAQAYGCLFRSLDPQAELAAEGLQLRRMALAIMGRYANAANQLQRRMSGYFRAAQMVREDLFALTTGPDALALAHELGALVPTRLVAPAFGPIRPVTQARGEGVFVVRAGVPEGPMTVSEAAGQLAPSPALGPGE